MSRHPGPCDPCDPCRICVSGAIFDGLDETRAQALEDQGLAKLRDVTEGLIRDCATLLHECGDTRVMDRMCVHLMEQDRLAVIATLSYLLVRVAQARGPELSRARE